MSNCKAVILAGGVGSRIRPYTFVVPKPLLPIGERPIIEITLRWLKCFGIDEVAIALGWRGAIIQSYLGDGSRYGLKIRYVQEEKRLGTVGPLCQLKDWIDGDVFMMNGDIITQLDVSMFLVAHKKANALLSVACKVHETKSPFGVLTVAHNQVVGLREKPTYREIISTGMYVLSPRVLDRIPRDQQYDITDLMKTLIDEGKVVHSHLFEEPWVAIEQTGELVDVAQNREWTTWADSLEHQNLQKLSAVKIEN